MKLVVAGGGYVGLATAVGFARRGHAVDLVEIDQARAQQLRHGKIPFDEPSLAEELVTAVDRSVRVHSHYPKTFGEIDFAFVCVDTAPTEGGHLDASRVMTAGESLLGACEGPLRLVLRSTVTPGTAAVLQSRLEQAGGRGTVLVNPEFLREGSALPDFEAPSHRVIGGIDEEAIEALAALYSFSDAPIIRTDPAAAELIKLAANAALATRISMANEIAYVAEAAGIDAEAVLNAIGADRRIGSEYLRPGIGFGGSCLPKDLNALRATARAAGVPLKVFEAAARTNDIALERVVAATRALIPEKLDGRVCVAGLGFKPGSESVRGSQSVRLVKALLGAGLTVSVFDPPAHANGRAELHDSVRYLSSLEEAMSEHDVVIEVHPYGAARLAGPRSAHVLDGLGRRLDSDD